MSKLMNRFKKEENSKQEAYTGLLWDVYLTDQLGPAVSGALKQPQGREALVAEGSMAARVADVVRAAPMFTPQEKEDAAPRLGVADMLGEHYAKDRSYSPLGIHPKRKELEARLVELSPDDASVMAVTGAGFVPPVEDAAPEDAVMLQHQHTIIDTIHAIRTSHNQAVQSAELAGDGALLSALARMDARYQENAFKYITSAIDAEDKPDDARSALAAAHSPSRIQQHVNSVQSEEKNRFKKPSRIQEQLDQMRTNNVGESNSPFLFNHNEEQDLEKIEKPSIIESLLSKIENSISRSPLHVSTIHKGLSH